MGNNSRILLKVQVVGYYLFLEESIKGRCECINQIEKEEISLWQKKLNFPNLSIQIVHAKLDQVLKTYNKCVKQGKYDSLNEVFDITKKKGEWLCSHCSKLSTRKAATICQQLSQDGIDVQTPLQSGVYRSTIKEAVKLKKK